MEGWRVRFFACEGGYASVIVLGLMVEWQNQPLNAGQEAYMQRSAIAHAPAECPNHWHSNELWR
jgi:hypothetical protein